jgi:hypothetical protein
VIFFNGVSLGKLLLQKNPKTLGSQPSSLDNLIFKEIQIYTIRYFLLKLSRDEGWDPSVLGFFCNSNFPRETPLKNITFQEI